MPISGLARIRATRSIAPELVALGLLYLGGLGADWTSVLPDARAPRYEIFIGGLLGFFAPVLIVLGSFLIWLSPRPKPAEKWAAVVSAILLPILLSQISPSLPGHDESCQGGSSYDPTRKLVVSYSYCSNGPNWVTHTVDWTWILLPLVLFLTLGALSLRRKRREHSPALAE